VEPAANRRVTCTEVETGLVPPRAAGWLKPFDAYDGFRKTGTLYLVFKEHRLGKQELYGNFSGLSSSYRP
jgi:hypothetical protein